MGFFDHCIDSGISCFAVADPHLDLDEFVMLERLMQLGGQSVGNPAVSDVNDRLEIVREKVHPVKTGVGDRTPMSSSNARRPKAGAHGPSINSVRCRSVIG